MRENRKQERLAMDEYEQPYIETDLDRRVQERYDFEKELEAGKIISQCYEEERRFQNAHRVTEIDVRKRYTNILVQIPVKEVLHNG